MSQAEIQIPNLSKIPHISSTKLTQFILKPLVSNKYVGIITIGNLFQGSLFSACDVTAWVREVMHWTSTEEKPDMKVRISLKPFNIKP